MDDRDVIGNPADIAEAKWLLELNADFIMDEEIPAPMVAIGRSAIVYAIGLGMAFGMTLPFPIRRDEAEAAIDHLRKVALLAKEIVTRRN